MYNGNRKRPVRYSLGEGTLSAPRIELWGGGEWIIASSSRANRITNSGQFSMAGILTVGDALEQFGNLIVSSNSTINLADGRAWLSFANSARQQWNPSANLTISNWAGLLGGGGNDQIKFGNSAAGLTESQLRQIRFANPAAFPQGQYAAKILATGEVVPVRTELSLETGGNTITIRWTGGGRLQSAPKVEGPYQDIPNGTSPFWMDSTAGQFFFRLSQSD